MTMPTKVIMPQMGESIAEGTVTKWLKRVGDKVERDEPLFEITTDKVDAEIPSPASGVLSQILVKENETVAVNTVVAEIDGEGAAAEAVARPAEKKKPAEAKKEVVSEPAEAEAAEEEAAEAAPAEAKAEEKVRSSPLVRRIAREHDVDLAEVKGSGLGGRVSKKDILDYIEKQKAAKPAEAPAAARTAEPAAPAPAAPPPGKPLTFKGPTLVVSMTPMRRQIAEHMVASKRTSAHVSTVFEVEMTKVVERRERCKAEFEHRNSLKLTYTPFFVRAAVKALKDHPIVNASVEGTNIVYKRDINVGVAVALEEGLIVPVIKRADEKNFLGIARALQDLADRARSKRLSVEDVQGGTFTITNPGLFGSLFGTPIIHQPQVAIMGIGVIEKRAVVRQDAIAIRPMVYLSISYDHRIIDGATADQFMARVKWELENWQEAVL
jgi:2-oxoglutarate dehydrogenase E2 component (dihydrolipoamide succinyltransferase)